MSRPIVVRPGEKGVDTDVEEYLIDRDASVLIQDFISPNGVLRGRRGWAYHDANTIDASSNSVNRRKYILADRTATISTYENATLPELQDGATSAITINSEANAANEYRGTYRDEDFLCSQDGVTPTARYSGSADDIANNAGTWTLTAEQATADYLSGTAGVAATVGQYVQPMTATAATGKRMWHRITAASTTSWTMEDVYSSATLSLIPASTDAYGVARTMFPSVEVWAKGTVSSGSANTLTGYGTDWPSTFDDDKYFVIVDRSAESASPLVGWITGYTSGTSISWSYGGTFSTKYPYIITRAPSFKDIANHKGSLWGIGVAEFPNRLYFFPPGYNPSLPPRAVTPYDIGVNIYDQFERKKDYLADDIDIGGAYSGDDGVAILETDEALLVLLRNSVHGAYGSWPNVTQRPIITGAGCIDRRSAISTDHGQFWASDNGVYHFQYGKFDNLMNGQVQRAFMDQVADFDFSDDSCVLGVTYDHLIVAMTVNGTTKNYVYDLRREMWISNAITNFEPKAMSTVRVPDETEALLFLDNATTTRIGDFTPAFNGTGTYQDADGTSPIPRWTSGSALAQTLGVEGETDIREVIVHANIEDTGADDVSDMSVKVISSGALDKAHGKDTYTAGTIGSRSEGIVDRYKLDVNASGRLHAIDIQMTTTAATLTKVEIPMVVLKVGDESLVT